MYTFDKKNFRLFLEGFPDQIMASYQIFNEGTLRVKSDEINNIIYCGMGGSAIAGDIIKETLYDQFKLPLKIVRGYSVPAYCSANSLVIASSYSGNTEETLAAVEDAQQKGAQIVAITSGGELLKKATDFSWSFFKLPQGYPPRQAFGYLFFIILHMFNRLDYCSISELELQSVIHIASSVLQRNNQKTSDGVILTKELAKQIQYNIPIIYSCSPYFDSVAVRWKNQFQENSKSMAFANRIPEMNHNEIVGWEMEHDCLRRFIVIFLENNIINPRIAARLRLTKKIIKDKGYKIAEIYGEGKTPLENVISFITLGDWTSYYLALFYEKDPMSILNIDFLKSELNKI